MTDALLRRQGFHNVVQNLLGKRAHLVIRTVLDGMADETAFGIHAEGIRLGGGGLREFA